VRRREQRAERDRGQLRARDREPPHPAEEREGGQRRRGRGVDPARFELEPLERRQRREVLERPRLLGADVHPGEPDPLDPGQIERAEGGERRCEVHPQARPEA
jgi:hypothetical protein